MENRAHLERWLAWPAAQTFEDTVGFIRAGEAQFAARDGLRAAIVCEDTIAGVVSFVEISRQHRRATLGYWLAADRQGQGLMTEAARRLVDLALLTWELNRVEIRVAAENERSRAIPERLGFTEEGVLRQAERIGDRYLDTVVYAMLAPGWRRTR